MNKDKKIKLLIAEDDDKIIPFVDLYFQREGFTSIYVSNGEDALDKFEKESPDIIILDFMMPKLNGLDVCRAIRRVSNVPIIMVTALAHEDDKLACFAAGVDDFMSKPFSPKELIARIKSILRRHNLSTTGTSGSANVSTMPSTCQVRDLFIDFETCQVELGGKPLDLTGFEYKLLSILAAVPGKVFSREAIMKQVYAGNKTYSKKSRTIDVHIGKLRNKLEKNPATPTYIITVRDIGYKLASD